jgi:hypothetical protein
MNLRALAATVLLVPAVAAVPAHAAVKKPKPVCNLLVDAKGDATQLYVAPEGTGPNDPALDVVSADVASNGKVITTVLRVDKLAKSGTTAPTGYVWYVYFTVNGQEFYTQTKSDPTGDVFSVGYVASGTGLRTALADSTAKGTFVTAKNEIHVTFNAAQLTELAPFKKGAKLVNLRALTNRGFVRVVFQADEATGGKTYTDSTPSCVKPGA